MSENGDNRLLRSLVAIRRVTKDVEHSLPDDRSKADAAATAALVSLVMLAVVAGAQIAFE